MDKFCERNGIGAIVRRVASNRHMADMGVGARHWVVTLTRGEKGVDYAEMRVPFSQGAAHTKPPTAADVLECLAMDALGYDNSRGFEDWAAQYGYDTYPRKAERTYRAVEKQAAELRAFLGPLFVEALEVAYA